MIVIELRLERFNRRATAELTVNTYNYRRVYYAHTAVHDDVL